MSKQKRSKFDELSQRAWRTIEDLTKSIAAKPLPVALDEVASSFGIRYIRFEPLLSTAKLVKIEAGFYILMNTEAPGANQPAGTILDAKGGKWLDLAPSLRFTVAHEVAHAIFLEAGWDWNRDQFSRHDRALESTCSQMARVLLLPAPRLVQEWDGRPFDVAHIRTLLKRFQVSPQVFVLRLNLHDLRGAFDGFDGMLAFAREEEKHIRIVAYHAWGPLATIRFKAIPSISAAQRQLLERKGTTRSAKEDALLEGNQINHLVSDFDVEAWLRTGARDLRPVPVAWRTGVTLPCEIKGCQIHSKPPGFFISIRVKGPPEADQKS